jgi:hypothetical protein
MRYRVIRPATLSGPVKADYAYDVGEILDSEAAPEGHVDRLLAVGALEPEAPPEDERQGAASGQPGARLARAGLADKA